MCRRKPAAVPETEKPPETHASIRIDAFLFILEQIEKAKAANRLAKFLEMMARRDGEKK